MVNVGGMEYWSIGVMEEWLKMGSQHAITPFHTIDPFTASIFSSQLMETGKIFL